MAAALATASSHPVARALADQAGDDAPALSDVQTLSGRGVRVTEGLTQGEWVATAGVNYLREGQKVRLLEQSAE